jgi:hypothetical protein
VRNLARTSATRVVARVTRELEPGAPIFDAEIVADVVPVRRPRPPAVRQRPADHESLDLVTDVSCTRCDRRVRNVSLLELAWSRPCPLCRQCRECERMCPTGAVTHDVAPPRIGGRR